MSKFPFRYLCLSQVCTYWSKFSVRHFFQVCIIADCIGSLFAYDVLCASPSSERMGSTIIKNRNSSTRQKSDDDFVAKCDLSTSAFESTAKERTDSWRADHECTDYIGGRHRRISAGPEVGRSTTTEQCSLDFDVSDCFLFGSPLWMVLTFRRVVHGRTEMGKSTEVLKGNTFLTVIHYKGYYSLLSYCM